MPALAIGPADVPVAPAAAPAQGAGASGFGTALDAALAGGPQQSPDAGRPSAPQTASARTQPPLTLGDAAAALVALLGRSAPGAPGDQPAAPAVAVPPAPPAGSDHAVDGVHPPSAASATGAPTALGTALPGRITADLPDPEAGASTPAPASAQPVIAAPGARAGAAASAVPSRQEDGFSGQETDPPGPPVASVGTLPSAGHTPGTRRAGDDDEPTDAAAPKPGDPAAPLIIDAPPPQVSGAPLPSRNGSAWDGAAAPVVVAAEPRTAPTSSHPPGDAAAPPMPGPGPAGDGSVPAAPAAVLPVPALDRPSAPDPSTQVLPVGPIAQVTAPAAAAPVPTAPGIVATRDPSIAQQLQGPLLSLRSAPEGEHVLVVRVTPDHLGPVTVHATVSHGDLAVQLFATSADARDALSTMLTDLRRDLGAGTAGSATTLSLGTGDAPQQDGRGQQAATTWFGAGTGRPGGRATGEDRPVRGASLRAAEDIPAGRPILSPSSVLLDVLA